MFWVLFPTLVLTYPISNSTVNTNSNIGPCDGGFISLVLTASMSRYIRQRTSLYQIQRRAYIDTLSYVRLGFSCFTLFSLGSCNIVDAIWTLRFKIVWRIYLDQLLEFIKIYLTLWFAFPRSSSTSQINIPKHMGITWRGGNIRHKYEMTTFYLAFYLQCATATP